VALDEPSHRASPPQTASSSQKTCGTQTERTKEEEELQKTKQQLRDAEEAKVFLRQKVVAAHAAMATKTLSLATVSTSSQTPPMKQLGKEGWITERENLKGKIVLLEDQEKDLAQQVQALRLELRKTKVALEKGEVRLRERSEEMATLQEECECLRVERDSLKEQVQEHREKAKATEAQATRMKAKWDSFLKNAQ